MPALNIENIRKPVAALYPVDVELRCVEVYIPDYDGYLWILAAFVAILGNDWAWLGTKTDRQTRAQLWQTAYAATLWDLCMKCEDLQECLQPFFDAINVRFDTIDAVQQQILDRINQSQTVQPPQPVEVDDCDEGKVYNGALQAVDQVNLLIEGIYKRSEVEAPDNLAEATNMLLSAIPVFETLPIDELGELTQWVFDNQRAMYEAAFVEEIEDHYWFEHAAGQLWCLVKDDCVIDHEKIGMWLSSLADIYPENYAAYIFTKFGNATQPTMSNQIGELLNAQRGGQSLAEFFDDIIIQFGVGAQSSNPDYLWIECGTGLQASTIGLFSDCAVGFTFQTVDFDDGVPFTLDAVELDITPGSYYLALLLPAGNWNVQLNSITGTITPPSDTTQTAYQWFDTSGVFHNVLWNAPAGPDDFGDHDTAQGFYAPWCDLEAWNCALFNEGPFTANFTVTAI